MKLIETPLHNNPASSLRKLGCLGLACCLLLSSPQLIRAQDIEPGDLEIEMDRAIDPANTSVLQLATMMTTAGDQSGRLFLPEQMRGRIRIENNGSYSTFLNIAAVDSFYRNPGLLGMAFHPGYADQQSPGYGKLYTFHAATPDPSTPQDFPATGNVPVDHVVTEWTVDTNDPNLVDITTRREIVRMAHTAINHNGGMLVFDANEYLNISNGTPGNNLEGAHSLQQVFGSILRIDPLDPATTPNSQDPVSANGKYRVPIGNPWFGNPAAIDELFVVGVRNMFRFSIDPVSGYYFGGDVGQGAREEVDAFGAGEYLGWPYWEGNVPGPVSPPNDPPDFRFPIAEYTHADGRAVMGGFVYRGSIAALQNKYIFAEFSWGQGQYNSSPGRLLWIDPFEIDGVTLKDPADIEIQEFQFGTDTIAQFNQNRFDLTVYGFGLDEQGELYIIGQVGNGARGYKIISAETITTADSVNVVLGSNTAGELSDVDLSDDSYLTYLRGAPFSPISPSIILEFEGELPTDTPNSVTVKLESQVTTELITQAIEMFNFNTGRYEQVQAQLATRNVDTVAEVVLPGDISRFIESGTGKVKTKITYTQGGNGLVFGWSASLDQFVWLSD